ncbi:MAG: DUF1350 family protein [Geitlerinemataceae cyanobacterium]
MTQYVWQTIAGSSALVPPGSIRGVIHFLGGAFVATAPQVTYRLLLEYLADRGFAIVATPFFNNTLDHGEIAKATLNSFEQALARLRGNGQLGPGYLPVYGLGHSMGCKLHLLIASLFEVDRAGNIFLAYNNFPAKRSVPFLERVSDGLSDPLARLREAARDAIAETRLADNVPADWKAGLSGLKDGLKDGLKQIDPNAIEFVPSPAETLEIVAADYPVRRNLLLRFRDDEIDQTLTLRKLLVQKFGQLVSYRTLNGNHLTPVGQDLRWTVGESFSPLDAVGQWMRQGVYQDLDDLKREVARWLDPTATGLQ